MVQNLIEWCEENNIKHAINDEYAEGYITKNDNKIGIVFSIGKKRYNIVYHEESSDTIEFVAIYELIKPKKKLFSKEDTNWQRDDSSEIMFRYETTIKELNKWLSENTKFTAIKE